MGFLDTENIELFLALEIIAEQEAKGYGPFDGLISEVQIAAW